jgi:hypothetical protein
MAATNTTIALGIGWTLVTTAATSGVPRIVIESGDDCRVMATVGAVAPVTLDGSIMVPVGEKTLISFAADFPGVTGADRLYVYSLRAGRCSISHL